LLRSTVMQGFAIALLSLALAGAGANAGAAPDAADVDADAAAGGDGVRLVRADGRIEAGRLVVRAIVDPGDGAGGDGGGVAADGAADGAAEELRLGLVPESPAERPAFVGPIAPPVPWNAAHAWLVVADVSHTAADRFRDARQMAAYF